MYSISLYEASKKGSYFLLRNITNQMPQKVLDISPPAHYTTRVQVPVRYEIGAGL